MFIFTECSQKITPKLLTIGKFLSIMTVGGGKIILYDVYFYRDKNGNEPVLEYIKRLANESNKDSRINLNKINDYIEMLKRYGTKAGEPYVKHIEKEIWELRPLRHRILFVGWINNSYVLLHHFIKKTKKTPLKEIERAKRELEDLIERGVIYE